jgi:hypothetical protein
MNDTITPTADTADCPPWCEDLHDNEREVDRGQPRLHKGPRFGQVSTWYSEIDTFGYTATVDVDEGVLGDDDLTANELRRLSADALAAAEWIEDKQRLPADPAAVRALRVMIEAAGFTIVGLTDDMSAAEVRRMAEEIGRRLAEKTA